MNTPNLRQLIVCRNLLTDETIQLLITALDNPHNETIRCQFISAMLERAENLRLSGNLLKQYFLYLLTNQENIVAKMVENSPTGEIGPSLYQAFYSDMKIITEFLQTKPSDLVISDLLDNYQPTIANSNFTSFHSSPENLANNLISYYRTYGYGEMAAYRAFRWDNQQLIGIEHFNEATLDTLIGYDLQKQELVANTTAFVNNKPANNVLLVGARGTGKSSSVKALANDFFTSGLRLLQITKPQLSQLSQIMEKLREYTSKKFIIFLDDLSFENFEVEYKYLKSAIEGGVTAKPDNVLIYATSNRRHLIKETWKDRGAVNDEIHRHDTLNETISLADRFGLTITYLAPNQSEYLKIADGLLKQAGITLDPNELRIQAVAWETTHSGRSGRTAQQFVTHYLSNH